MMALTRDDIEEFYKLEYGKDWRYAKMLNLIPAIDTNRRPFLERLMLRFEMIGCMKAAGELTRLGYPDYAKRLDDRRLEIIDML